MDIFKRLHTPLGDMIAKSDGERITGLWFAIQGEPADLEIGELAVFDQLQQWLDLYFAGKEVELPPLAVQGTPFQKCVWKIVRAIEYGKTMSYQQVAQRVAQQLGRSAMSSQAVGTALGKNPLLLLIPCHRVIGSDGKLHGYAAGLEIKQALLEQEKQ